MKNNLIGRVHLVSLYGEQTMKTRFLIISLLLLVVFMSTGFIATPARAGGAVKVGPFAGNTPDSGTCGNDWANDSFDRMYNATPAGFTERFENGTFVTIAGHSPNACGSGSDNGSMVQAGVTGKMHGAFDVAVSSATQFTPDACNQSLCGTTAGFVHTVYGLAASYSPGATFFQFHYNACSAGDWMNASPNRGGNVGDITGNPGCK